MNLNPMMQILDQNSLGGIVFAAVIIRYGPPAPAHRDAATAENGLDPGKVIGRKGL
jgi:hypothetical protein